MKYRRLKNYKYQLEADYSYPTRIKGYLFKTPFLRMDKDGTLTLYKGYAWDGASGPMPDCKSIMRASMLHDALYQLIKMKALPPKAKRIADRILRREALKDGLPVFMGWIVYKAVVMFGRLFGRLP